MIDEVLANVKHQRLGTGTLEDLALPEEFVRRFADRVIRSSYEESFRIVVKDPEPVIGVGDEKTVGPGGGGAATALPANGAHSTVGDTDRSSWFLRGGALLFAAAVVVWIVRRQRKASP